MTHIVQRPEPIEISATSGNKDGITGSYSGIDNAIINIKIRQGSGFNGTLVREIDVAGEPETHTYGGTWSPSLPAGTYRVIVNIKGTQATHDQLLIDIIAPSLSSSITVNIVQGSPPGTGTVISSTNPGITCPGDCTESWEDDTIIRLEATPDVNSLFETWGGDTPAGAILTNVTIDIPVGPTDKIITATFKEKPVGIDYDIAVGNGGAGEGRITGTITGVGTIIDCPSNPQVGETPDCTEINLAPGTIVNLTATPSAGHRFTNWSGSLTGSATPVNITMNANKLIQANFEPIVSEDSWKGAQIPSRSEGFPPISQLTAANMKCTRLINGPIANTNWTLGQALPPVWQDTITFARNCRTAGIHSCFLFIQPSSTTSLTNWLDQIDRICDGFGNDSCEYMELGNEMQEGYAGGNNWDIWFDRVEAASPIIRSYGIKVVLGASGHTEIPTYANGANAWRSNIDNGRIWPLIDGFAIHPYASTVSGSITKIQNLHNQLVGFGGVGINNANKQIWITEMGWGNDIPTGPPFPPDKTVTCPGATQAARDEEQRLRCVNSLNQLFTNNVNWNLKFIAWFLWRNYGDGSSQFNSCGLRDYANVAKRALTGVPGDATKPGFTDVRSTKPLT